MSVRRKRIGLKGKLLLAFMPMATVPLVVMQRNAAYLAPRTVSRRKRA
jgi:hypothetical protein